MIIAVGYGIMWWHTKNRVVTAATLLQKPQTFSQVILSKSFGVLIGYTAVVILFSGSPYTPSLRELISQQSTDTAQTEVTEPAVVNRLDIGGTDSGEIRKIVWQGALNVWKRYPVLGSGVETFAYSYYQDRPVAHNMVSEWDFLYNKAHNEFLNFLATTGALGLLAYLSLICGYMWWAVTGFFRLVNEKKYDDARIVLAMAGAVAGLSVSNFFGFSTVVVTILQYLAFAVTMLLLIKSPALPKQPKTISAWQMSLMGLTAIAALFPLKGILDHYRADQLYTAGKGLMTQGDIQGAALKITTAIKLSPRESLFWDELSQLYAQAAVSYAQSSEMIERAEPLAVEVIAASDQAMSFNNRQLNQYKTRARMFIILSQLDETYVNDAVQTLEQAVLLSPTDPKLLYNLGILKSQQGDAVSGLALLEKAVALKPNYVAAATELIRQNWAAGKQETAVTQLKELILYEPASVELENLLASYSAELLRKTK
jgi:Flp pilus assembly protein TadD